MASVTGLSAERMLEIEAKSIVGGYVNAQGELVLKNRNDETINAGIVQGMKGTGVRNTIVDYKYSDSPTVPPIGTWETAIGTLPEGSVYLWTRTRIIFTDDTTETLYSIGSPGKNGNDGVPGIPGADGRPSYLHVAYSTSPTGNQGFSTTDATGKTYIGTYSDFEVEDSQFPGAYKWVLIKGLDGADGPQGVPGPPGSSMYTWIKYADTPTSGMSDLPAGKTYLGMAYNKESSSESNDYNDYTWSLLRGTDGVRGPPGADGASTYVWVKYSTSAFGANMSDSPDGMSYIGLAYNKSTPTESAVASDYQWALIKGPEGNGIVSSVVTYQVSTSGTTAPTGTWSSTVPLVAAGQFLWTRTIITFADGAKTTSYSLGRFGDNGATGPTGPSGVGVTSMTTWYRAVTAGAAAPAKPTTAVPSGWTSVEPLYVEGTELYTTIQIVYTTSTFTYSNVSKDSSYTAASEAVALALSAQTTADGKNKIIRQPTTPSSTGRVVGDLWYKTESSSATTNVIGILVWNGSTWANLQLTADSLVIPGSITDISLADGAVTAEKVSADVFVGRVIMGAEIRGTYISGSEYHLTAYTGESSIYFTSFTSLTGWSVGNADSTIALDASVGHDTNGSLKVTAPAGKTTSVKWNQVPEYTELGSSELTFWILTPTSARVNVNYAGKKLRFYDIPANIWTQIVWSGWVTQYEFGALTIYSSGTTTFRIDEVKLVTRAAATREIRLVRQANGTPTFEATAENGVVTGRWSAHSDRSGFEIGGQEVQGGAGFLAGSSNEAGTALFHKNGITQDPNNTLKPLVIANVNTFGTGVSVTDVAGPFSSTGLILSSTRNGITLKPGTDLPRIDYTFGWLDARTRMSRWGTSEERIAQTPTGGVRDATRWFESDTGFEWEYRAGKWFLVPGQLLDYMQGPTTQSSGAGTQVGTIITTPNLQIGQKIRISSTFNQLNTVAGVSIIRTAWRNSSIPVDAATYNGSLVSRAESSVANRVMSGRGGSAIRVANIADRPVTAGIFIIGEDSVVQGSEGTYLYLYSA